MTVSLSHDGWVGELGEGESGEGKAWEGDGTVYIIERYGKGPWLL